MDVTAKFLGATGTVTGSRFLIELDGFRFLFDCGLFQGLKDVRIRNWEEFPINPSTIDAVVISHAHIDHTGYLPKLVKEGFSGPIYCTHPTADLMEIMLTDSARLQEEEARYAEQKGYSKHDHPKPLYTEKDAHNVFPLVRSFGYKEEIKIHDAVTVIFHDAGHLLGSAITEVFIQGENQRKKIVFSGDLGRYTQELMNAPTAIMQADILFIESTYGIKDNPIDDPMADFQRIATEAIERGGVLLIPAFSVGRTQAILNILHRLMKEDKIPDVPVYIDSPMAISATYLFFKHPSYHKAPINQKEFAHEMETNMLVFVRTAEHSKSLNDIKKNAIIISASGMMTGGRIMHHLFHRLKNPNDTLLIAGYQAEGTRGRRIVDGEDSIKIFGERVPVNCKVENITSLSGHADKEELFKWMGNFKEHPKLTFTIHGENEDVALYAQSIRDRLHWNVMTPDYLESVSLFRGI